MALLLPVKWAVHVWQTGSGSVYADASHGPSVLSLQCGLFLCWLDRLGGLVVKASASRAEDPGFESRLHRDFSGSSHTSDLEICTPVATLPGAWRYRVSTGTGQPGVCIL